MHLGLFSCKYRLKTVKKLVRDSYFWKPKVPEKKNFMKNELNSMALLEDWTINLKDSWQVLWLCNSLGITKTQLERAIESVGTMVIDVKGFVAPQRATA